MTDWSSLPARPVLPERSTIHLFRVSLAASRYHADADWSALTTAERARAERYVVEPPRYRFLLCRRALRHCLAWLTDVSPADLAFAAARFGKPHLQWPEKTGWGFNVSHSGDWGIIAVAWQRQVGVDLEVIDPRLDTAGLAERFFAIAEQQQLSALPLEQQTAGFYRIWNTKEAYLKALGVGMSLPLGSFTVSADPQGTPGVIGGDVREGPWWGHGFEVATTAAGVVLWDQGPTLVQTWDAPAEW